MVDEAKGSKAPTSATSHPTNGHSAISDSAADNLKAHAWAGLCYKRFMSHSFKQQAERPEQMVTCTFTPKQLAAKHLART